tara:strand:- start:981 stop:1178 length:198 start_codon:yes stop_codon:yes gene_type:complete
MEKLIKQYRAEMHDLAKGIVDDYGWDIDKASSLESDEAVASFDAGYYHALIRVCNDLHEGATNGS